MQKPFKFLAVLGLCAFLLAACGTDTENTSETQQTDTPVEELYNKAYALLGEEKYYAAATAFDEVERQHPYSQWASKAQLMASYAFYQAEQYTEAELAIDRFIQLHPSHENVDYAYYLKAIIHYEQINDIARDQSTTKMAMDYLQDVIRRFPDSPYARDAKLKIDLTLDHLAAKEMQIGRFYQERKLHNAAISRFRNVVDQYQTTSQAPEALHRLVECYLSLGIIDQAQATAAVLGHNYPGSDWYQYSYNLLTSGRNSKLPAPTSEKKSFIGRTIDSIF